MVPEKIFDLTYVFNISYFKIYVDNNDMKDISHSTKVKHLERIRLNSLKKWWICETTMLSINLQESARH